MSKLQTTMSTLSYIDQMSLHIQDDRKVEQQVLFIHLFKTIPSNHLSILKTKIQHKYRNKYQLSYYESYKEILTLSLKNQPVCIIFVCFEDRSWAKKFCSNQQLSQRFRMYIVTTSEEQHQKAQKYNTKHLKSILFPNDIDDVSTQICLLSQKSIRTDSNKLIYPPYFQHYSSQKLVTIYISSQLAFGFQSQGKKILKNKEHKNVQIRQFKNIQQFIFKLKNDMDSRKKSKMQVDQLIIEECQNKKLSQQQLAKLWKSKQLEVRNLIFIEKQNANLGILKQLIFSDDYRRWEIISIDESESMCERIPNHYADYPFPQQHVPELNQIIQSQELYILINSKETQIVNDIQDMNKMNCNNRLFVFSNNKELGQMLTKLQLKQNSYGILIISSATYKEYRSVIRSYIDSQFPILNLKILVTESLLASTSILSYESSSILGQQNVKTSQYQNWLTSNFLPNENKPLIEFILEERCTYFYPAYGLEQRKIVLLVNYQQSEMISLAQQIVKKNQRRISIEYWNGLEHVKYILSKLKHDEWGLVFVYQNELKSSANVLNIQSQLIVVGDNYKKYSHHKILKQGQPHEIIQFFNLIPTQQSSSILSTGSSIPMYNDSQLIIQTLKRLDFDDNILTETQSDYLSQNSSIFQIKLIQKLKEKVIVKYYGTTSEIRDMGNRWQQTTQYLIVTDDYLEWTEEFAKKQIKQRFQILLYTYDNVEDLQRLITKPNYSRFKLITNRWSQIQAYITRSNELFVQEQQRIQIVLGQSDRRLQNLFQNSNLLSRTYFKYYNQSKQSSIKQIIKQLSPKNLIFVVLNQNSQNINQQRVIQDIVKSNPSARTILVSQVRKSTKPRTIVSLNSIQAVVTWINKIKVRGSVYSTKGSVRVNKLK